jgi:hypothetical protein
MNNAVVVTIYNRTPAQHDLTVSAVKSALAQDIPIDLILLNNGSTFGPTRDWLYSIAVDNIAIHHYPHNISPVKLANEWMDTIFSLGYPHILGLPNDVIIPPNLYREFLKWPRGVVTGSMTRERDHPIFEKSSAMNECTPMAVALVRKWCYDALIARDGFFFDPQFFLYASDCDFALRIASCGIRGIQLDLQYFHHGSASHRLGPPDKVSAMAYRADQDRAKFVKKWGFKVDDLEYGALAGDINFRGESK